MFEKVFNTKGSLSGDYLCRALLAYLPPWIDIRRGVISPSVLRVANRNIPCDFGSIKAWALKFSSAPMERYFSNENDFKQIREFISASAENNLGAMIIQLDDNGQEKEEHAPVKGHQRIPLVLWSGGLDSTLLLFKELTNGDVDTLEIEFGNTFQHHSEAEELARESIVKKLNELRESGIIKGRIRNRHHVKFEYSTSVHQRGLDGYGQQPAWLFVAYMNSHPLDHSCVLSGILMSDTVAIVAEPMRQAWDALREMNLSFSQKRRYGLYEPVTLEFPLLHQCYTKEAAWGGDLVHEPCSDALENWNRIRELTWSCCKPLALNTPTGVNEGYVTTYKPCLECDSCKARAVVDPNHRYGRL